MVNLQEKVTGMFWEHRTSLSIPYDKVLQSVVAQGEHWEETHPFFFGQGYRVDTWVNPL